MLHPKGLKPAQLADAIAQVLANPEYKRKTIELQKMTEKLNGIENVVQIIRSYL